MVVVVVGGDTGCLQAIFYFLRYFLPSKFPFPPAPSPFGLLHLKWWQQIVKVWAYYGEWCVRHTLYVSIPLTFIFELGMKCERGICTRICITCRKLANWLLCKRKLFDRIFRGPMPNTHIHMPPPFHCHCHCLPCWNASIPRHIAAAPEYVPFCHHYYWKLYLFLCKMKSN